jgi:hypothetical protein
MTLQDLGNLGEFIGAFAVIASLIYVAMQLRQNTQSLRTSSFQAAMQSASQDTRLLTQNAEVAALYLRGLESFSSLDPVERIRFQSLMLNTVWSFEITLSLHEEGVCADTRLAAHLQHVLSDLASPGGSEWWEGTAGMIDEKVRSFIDSHLNANTLT